MFTGYLAEFSLPEVFQFLEQGHKTGLVTIRDLPTAQTQQVQSYYIWLHQGLIVAAADRLDNEGLISMMAHRGWTNERVVSKFVQLCPLNTPIGLCLKSQGVLQAEQLKLIFRTRVVGQVTALFQLKNGHFEFNPNAALPPAEMTGLSLPATEITLMGLRALRDWTALAEKLPDPTSGITSTITGKPRLPLNSLEWQVWEFANGTISLQGICAQLGLPIEQVQQISFRLIVTNLAEEVPVIATAPTPAVAATPRAAKNLLGATANSSKVNVSHSFLQNLVSFLQGKA